MSTTKISALTSANSIDAANDYLPIVQSGTTKKINRNILMGTTGTPMDTSTAQNVTNKTMDNTNALTVKDTLFTLQDDGDTTKQVKFQVSSVTTGTTRTLTVPNASVTLASLTGTETLTNKTITSPTITGGTIDNSTITVDSISGHTSAGIVTVGGVQFSSGVVNTANAVTATSIAAGGVQPQALQSGTGTSWAWTSWTPTLTTITVGNGTLTCRYMQTGKQVTCKFLFTLGTTSSVGTGTPTLTLPVAAHTSYATAASNTIVGTAMMNRVGTNYFTLFFGIANSTSVASIFRTSADPQTLVGVSSTLPATWTAGDVLAGTFTYEAA